MAYAPAVVVEGPARQALPYGLFSVLTPRSSGGDPHWQNGVIWETLTCEPVLGLGDPSCDTGRDTTGIPKQFAASGLPGAATPFAVYGSYTCTPLGHSPEYAQAQAVAHLLAREEARVEQAIWSGDLDNTGFITGATSVGTALSLARGLAALEQWIATEYGSLGVIHVTRDVALLLLGAQLAVVKGSSLYTALGTPIVAGAGYPGTSPLGAAPAAGSAYLYATPALLGYRSEPFAGASPASAGFDRATNDMLAVAERTYVVGWDSCGTAVVSVTL